MTRQEQEDKQNWQTRTARATEETKDVRFAVHITGGRSVAIAKTREDADNAARKISALRFAILLTHDQAQVWSINQEEAKQLWLEGVPVWPL